MTIPQGRLAVVTGSGGNLGPIWCAELRKYGVEVFELDLPDYDVTSYHDLDVAREEIHDTYGRGPDLIINNAAIDNPPGSDATFFGNMKTIIEVNLLGVAKVVETFLNDIVEEGGGNIVNIGSMLGFIASNPELYPEGFDKPFAYGAAKAGLWNFTNNCNVRFAKLGVVSNMLALSAVEGSQSKDFKEKYAKKIPIGRMLRREDFVNEFHTCAGARVPYDAPLFVGGGYTVL